MLPESEGGRVSPLSKEAYGGNYRPHMVVGSRNQREAIVEVTDEHPRTLTEKYRGVAFISGPSGEEIPVNTRLIVVLQLMYYPDVDFLDVVEGTTFTLREGGKIVGHGEVLRRWHYE